MGLAGGLVKRVFSKHRSPCGRDGNMDKSRWSLSKLSLCGDDFDSVHAEVTDLTSYICSEITVTEPGAGASETSATLPSSESSCKGGEDVNEGTNAEDNKGEMQDPVEERQLEECAAIVIQTAFRDFQARRRCEQIEEFEECAEMETSSRASLATSVEVQVGDSVKNLSVQGESISIPHRVPHKNKTCAWKSKEEWDDSTVSSNVSKLRIQNRLEAMTRRERALAYAFSQQLRVCSGKKKQAHSDHDPNMSWTWLERWMATRRPEFSMPEDCSSKQLQSCIDHKPSILRKKPDINLQESCGSNDVPASSESSVIPSLCDLKDGYKAVKNRLKAPRDTKRRNTIQRYHYTVPPNKVIKSLREIEKEKRQKKMQEKTAEDLHA